LDVKLAVMERRKEGQAQRFLKCSTFVMRYDPEGKHYTFNVVRISGVVIVGLVAVFMFVFVVNNQKES